MAGILVAIGTLLALAGVGAVLWCLFRAVGLRADRTMSDEESAAVLRRIVTVNLAGMGVASLGLGCLLAGLIL